MVNSCIEKYLYVYKNSKYTLRLKNGVLIMTALQRLQEKIEQLKDNYAKMRDEIDDLKSELEGFRENKGDQGSVVDELKKELEEKDREIEKVVAKVEELLNGGDI